MYRKLGVSNNIKTTIQQSTRLYPSFLPSSFSLSTKPKHKDPNLVDDIRESASGMPPAASSPPGASQHRVHDVAKTSTTIVPPVASSSNPSYHHDNIAKTTRASPSDIREGDDSGSYVAETVKQGVVKAMETGLDIGEMAKKTLDNVWDATKDTTHQVKKAVAGDDETKYDVPPTDRFVDDLRDRADDGYDLRRRNNYNYNNNNVLGKK
ncbi:hypothetical protein QVD17_32768 [Tagetes erecta]|uniref:Uncharacterized protein n=1 Tax=Tagetes erecta TaxID=13708 RepID=A0AAD8JY40_TARER|nr:hypothetical protein QVD17_32768 [Tagetes erecta]